jgi:hypothetical protein
MPPNLLSTSTFPKCVLLSPGCCKDSAESRISFAKSSPTTGLNPQHRAIVAEIVAAHRLVPPGHTLDTIPNPLSPAPMMALHDESRSFPPHHLEEKNRVLMTPYPTGRIPSLEAFRFPLISLTLPTHLGAPHSILGTIGLHLLQ